MVAVKRWLNTRFQSEDANGNPHSGAKLFFYAAGSSTKQNTYTTSAGSVANSNPITLNSLGQPAVEIWLIEGQSYKVGLASSTESDPPGSFIWEEDNVTGTNDTTGLFDEWVASGDTPTFISTTSFSVTGDETSKYHKGRRLKTTNTGGTVYSTVVSSSFSSITTVTVANDSSVLDSGLSAVQVSLVKADNPSISPDMVHRKGTAVASAATCDIWGIVGDFVHITGTTTITSLGTAPYAGAERTVIFDGALTLTHNATTLVLPGGANITTAANDRMVVRADTTANMHVISYVKADGTAVVVTAKTPTRQVFTSGSGTYTTPAGTTRINVRMVGGGGGGGGSGTASNTAGGNGGSTTFSTFTAAGGTGGSTGTGGAVGAGGAGGAPSGSPDIGISGGNGGAAIISTGALNANQSGGLGGSSVFGGSGLSTLNTGVAGKTNSGAGGSGGAGTTSTFPAGGGGAGAYVETAVTTPAGTYSYAVGAAGTAGAIGTSGNAGGAGGSGLVIVDEYYT